MLILLIIIGYFSCSYLIKQTDRTGKSVGVLEQTANNQSKNSQSEITKEKSNTEHSSLQQPLVLTFAGDLMAHKVNFLMNDYDLIYKDVEKILHDDDLSFINVETPVCDWLPLSTYPSFNVHTSYLRAAVQGGFDVFSFANNHTNDYGTTGIDGTLAAVRAIQQEYNAGNKSETTGKILAFSGLKDSVEASIRITPIVYRGWNILFCAVTEILNSYDASKNRLYYSAPTDEGRSALISFIKRMRRVNPHSLFILSLHLNEPEYVRTVSKTKKEWFRRLGEAGVDIIWAHHPHVMQAWETITVQRQIQMPKQYRMLNPVSENEEYEQLSDLHRVFCMYSMGNFISGQRWNVCYTDPSFYREYTGDAVILQLRCVWNCVTGIEFSVSPILITQYNDPDPVVKCFTPEWVDTLNEKEKKYFQKRYLLMKDYLPF